MGRREIVIRDNSVTSPIVIRVEFVTSEIVIRDNSVTSQIVIRHDFVTPKIVIRDSCVTSRIVIRDDFVTPAIVIRDNLGRHEIVTNDNLGRHETVTSDNLGRHEMVTNYNLGRRRVRLRPMVIDGASCRYVSTFVHSDRRHYQALTGQSLIVSPAAMHQRLHISAGDTKGRFNDFVASVFFSIVAADRAHLQHCIHQRRGAVNLIGF